MKRYQTGGDLSSLSMILSQLLQTQNSRVEDEKGSGIGVASSTLSGALKGLASGASLGPAGMIGGTLIGGIGSLINARKMQREAEEQRQREIDTKQMQEQNRSSIVLQDYPVSGLGVSSYYKYGGDMSSDGGKFKVLSGGKIQKLSGKAYKLIGDTHSEDSNSDGASGIRVTYKGQEAEVEDQEILYDNMVLSNSLVIPGTDITFASAAEEVARSSKFAMEESKRNQAEERMKMSTNYLDVNVGKRNAMKYKANPIKDLFEMQERMKAEQAQAEAQAQQQSAMEGAQEQPPVGKKGIDLEMITPFVDNITNAFLTARAPKVPLPRLNTAPQLRTKVDTSGQLANIQNSEALYGDLIQSNTNSSNVATARLGALRANSLAMKNELESNKVNQENALVNQNLQSEYANRANNNAMMSEYDRMKFKRTDDISTQVSANAANLTEDLKMQQMDKAMKTRDSQSMFMVLTKYANSGVLERANLLPAMEDLEKGIPLAEVLKKYGKATPGASTSAAPTQQGQVPQDAQRLHNMFYKYLSN
jgi:hypothetical protein